MGMGASNACSETGAATIHFEKLLVGRAPQQQQTPPISAVAAVPAAGLLSVATGHIDSSVRIVSFETESPAVLAGAVARVQRTLHTPWCG
eukprot:SAG31_NODE_31448_length_368_cov_0.750929_1_plen_89_part_01